MNEPSTQLQTVNVHRAGGVATVELNRPEALNAWNAQFGVDLLAALRGLAEDDAVRAVVITGAGRALLLRRRPEGRGHRRDQAATDAPTSTRR